MSIYDPDRLPTGVAPHEAAFMGISPDDNRHDAHAKWQTHMLRQNMQSRQDFLREQDAALEADMRARSSHVPSAHEVFVQYLGLGKIKHTRHLAGYIEEHRRTAVARRQAAVRFLAPAAKLSWLLAAVLCVVVLLNIVIPGLSFNGRMAEYFIVRGALVVAVVCGWQCTKRVRAAVSAEEEDWTAQAQAMRHALERNYAFKKEKDSAPRDWFHLLDGYSVPMLALQPRFVHDFNEHYRQRTGKDIPYVGYQFNEHYAQRLCLVPHGWDIVKDDLAHGRVVELDNILDVKLPPDMIVPPPR